MVSSAIGTRLSRQPGAEQRVTGQRFCRLPVNGLDARQYWAKSPCCPEVGRGVTICPSVTNRLASHHAPVRPHGVRRDRRLLPALPLVAGRKITAAAGSCGAVLGALCLVAHASSHGSRQGLCRLWGGLCLCGAGLVAGRRWGAADASGPCGCRGCAGGYGGSDGRWAAWRLTLCCALLSDEAS